MAVQFRCRDVGAACRAVTTAATSEELVAKVGAHVRQAHGVELTETLLGFALTKVSETGRRQANTAAANTAAAVPEGPAQPTSSAAAS